MKRIIHNTFYDLPSLSIDLNGFAARVGRSAFKSAARHPGLHSSGAAPLYYDRLQIVFKIARLPCCCISQSNLQHSSRSICMCTVRENTGDCPLRRALVFVCYDSAWLSVETCSISTNNSPWAQVNSDNWQTSFWPQETHL